MGKRLQLIVDDGWLEPYEYDINKRFDYFNSKLDIIKKEFVYLLYYRIPRG